MVDNGPGTSGSPMQFTVHFASRSNRLYLVEFEDLANSSNCRSVWGHDNVTVNLTFHTDIRREMRQIKVTVWLTAQGWPVEKTREVVHSFILQSVDPPVEPVTDPTGTTAKPKEWKLDISE